MISFRDKIYVLIEHMPAGKITTYGHLAKKAGVAGGTRAVGSILKNYPAWKSGNCYRVVKSDGSVGGYRGYRVGPEQYEKIDKLKKLGCVIDDRGIILNFEDMLW